MESIGHYGGLIAWALVYIATSTAEISAVKGLNYKADVWLPVYSAIMLNQLWILVLPSYLYQRYKHNRVRMGLDYNQASRRRGSDMPDSVSVGMNTPSYVYARRDSVDTTAGLVGDKEPPTLRQRAVAYGFLGIVMYAVTFLRNLSANNIPGSVFSLLTSMSIVFNMLLSYWVLKRRFTRWHLAAAATCVSVALILGFSGPMQAGVGNRYSIGIPAAVGASFCIAAMTVASDKIMSQWPDRELRISEMTIVGSLIASILLVPTLFLMKENTEWGPVLSAAWNAPSRRPFLIGLSVALPVAKALVRTSKYQTIGLSSAFFFEFVQSSSAILAAIVNVILFGEPWTNSFVIAMFVMVAAFGLYMRGRYVTMRQKRRSSEVSLPDVKAAVSCPPKALAQADEVAAQSLTNFATTVAGTRIQLMHEAEATSYPGLESDPLAQPLPAAFDLELDTPQPQANPMAAVHRVQGYSFTASRKASSASTMSIGSTVSLPTSRPTLDSAEESIQTFPITAATQV